ncbi:MAG: hypothetical protein GEU28_11360 [Dehalococcoidia bacterium]|nr:hypothetical protein [Dehalococcoidia bacterium]
MALTIAAAIIGAVAITVVYRVFGEARSLLLGEPASPSLFGLVDSLETTHLQVGDVEEVSFDGLSQASGFAVLLIPRRSPFGDVPPRELPELVMAELVDGQLAERYRFRPSLTPESRIDALLREYPLGHGAQLMSTDVNLDGRHELVTSWQFYGANLLLHFATVTGFHHGSFYTTDILPSDYAVERPNAWAYRYFAMGNYYAPQEAFVAHGINEVFAVEGRIISSIRTDIYCKACPSASEVAVIQSPPGRFEPYVWEKHFVQPTFHYTTDQNDSWINREDFLQYVDALLNVP